MPGRHPWPACEEKCTRRLPQVRPDTPGLPCAMGYGLYAISPGIGCVAPVCVMRKHHRIGASTEAPEPRDFTVRDAPLVRANQVRARPLTSTAFLSHATDDPDAPLEWMGTKREHKLICRSWQGFLPAQRIAMHKRRAGSLVEEDARIRSERGIVWSALGQKFAGTERIEFGSELFEIGRRAAHGSPHAALGSPPSAFATLRKRSSAV